jgi:hypothetical protein
VNDSAFLRELIDAERDEFVWKGALLESLKEFVIRTIVVVTFGRGFGAATTKRSKARNRASSAGIFVLPIALRLASTHAGRTRTDVRRGPRVSNRGVRVFFDDLAEVLLQQEVRELFFRNHIRASACAYKIWSKPTGLFSIGQTLFAPVEFRNRITIILALVWPGASGCEESSDERNERQFSNHLPSPEGGPPPDIWRDA